MKKSELFHKAQLSVLYDASLKAEEQLEILKLLIEDEELAKFQEEREEIV